DFLHHPVEHYTAELRMRHLTATKHHGDLDLVALLQEPPRVAGLELEIVLLDTRPQLHFLQLHPMLLFPGVPSFPLFLITKLAVIHDPADRWSREWSDLHEVESPLFRRLQRFLDWQDAEL